MTTTAKTKGAAGPMNGLNTTDAKSKILAILKRKYFGREALDAFIRANYDRNYLSFFGMEGAYQSYIMHVRDDNGIAVGYDDCLAIAAEIYKEGF